MKVSAPVILRSGIVLLVVCLVAAAAAFAAQAPSLRLLRLRPLEVQGLAFKPGERVTVVLRTDVQRVRRVSADRAGRFAAEFLDVRVDRCSGFTVTAVGNRGSRAALRSRDLFECPQPASA